MYKSLKSTFEKDYININKILKYKLGKKAGHNTVECSNLRFDEMVTVN